MTYFSIPPCTWIALAILLGQQLASEQVPKVSISPIEIGVYVIFGVIVQVLIGIPVLVAFVRGFVLAHRHRNGPATVAELVYLVSMFRLPAPFCRTHRWFVPVYYGSLVVALIAQLVSGGWQLLQMM